MTADEFERQVRLDAQAWAFIDRIVIIDKTEYAIKMRLHITATCFIQIYANVFKKLISYTLVLNRDRIFGRDCDGGEWHRHPYGDADTHDDSIERGRAVSLTEFLVESEQILRNENIL